MKKIKYYRIKICNYVTQHHVGFIGIIISLVVTTAGVTSHFSHKETTTNLYNIVENRSSELTEANITIGKLTEEIEQSELEISRLKKKGDSAIKENKLTSVVEKNSQDIQNNKKQIDDFKTPKQGHTVTRIYPLFYKFDPDEQDKILPNKRSKYYLTKGSKFYICHISHKYHYFAGRYDDMALIAIPYLSLQVDIKDMKNDVKIFNYSGHDDKNVNYVFDYFDTYSSKGRPQHDGKGNYEKNHAIGRFLLSHQDESYSFLAVDMAELHNANMMKLNDFDKNLSSNYLKFLVVN